MFVALTHLSGHVALPVSGAELAVEGHGVGPRALYVPGIVLAASLCGCASAACVTLAAARHLVARHAVGPGPRNSLIVCGSDVLFVVAG